MALDLNDIELWRERAPLNGSVMFTVWLRSGFLHSFSKILFKDFVVEVNQSMYYTNYYMERSTARKSFGTRNGTEEEVSENIKIKKQQSYDFFFSKSRQVKKLFYPLSITKTQASFLGWMCALIL